MFPQSELDNYKLQVELLQEKLQRSEISRQQLEHKLEKLLQKRNEHEKMARSKAKQKYQQFLEEQQRRNERNKQLVQMLERIEQQTEIMNARSERLKMMKLQYEMYFAKLVHSQTRRCIQNTVAPVVPMMTATSSQPLAQTTTPIVQQQPVMEGYNYNLPNANTPLMATYQRYATAPNFEKEQYSRQQYINMPSNEAMEMPTLANFTKQNRGNEIDFRNEPSYEINGNKFETLPHDIYKKNDIDFSHITNMTCKPTRTFESASHLLPVHKEPADQQLDSENLTTTTSSTFEEIPNVKMMPQMQINHKPEKYINNTIDSLSKNNQLESDMNNKEVNDNLYPMKPQSSTSIKSIPKTIANISENNNQIRNNVEDITLNKTQVQDIITPGVVNPPQTASLEIDQVKPSYDTLQKSLISMNTRNIKTENTELSSKLPIVPLNNNSETNSSVTPVSIENIENAIYGELLSPLEAEQEQNQEPASIVPTILENLVTQPETLETQKSLEDHTEIKLDISSTNNINEIVKEFEENSNKEASVYEQDTNPQQSETLANNESDYGTYENVDQNTINDTQQDQQYDYSNYDPTQYSYPGYIYDEATGEYKPDPNAPPDQYTADQQYATEDYDQQYQQQDAYDYNQAYAQEMPSNLDNNAYNNSNYETAQLENASNITTVDSNMDQQELQQPQYSETEPQPQPLEEPKENTSEEQSQLPAKVSKPTSILSTTEKNDNQKKKKRVNFVDSSEADESVTDKEVALKPKPSTGGSSESDFDFSSSVEGEAKTT